MTYLLDVVQLSSSFQVLKLSQLWKIFITFIDEGCVRIIKTTLYFVDKEYVLSGQMLNVLGFW